MPSWLLLTLVSAVFQAGGLFVVLVEVSRKAYLASIVPVIVNAILNEHQIVVDIVAFVNKGDFPRSRLGEKQRGKILGSWVTRKMRTMAQFGIRDADGMSDVTETGPARNSSVMASSLRNVEPAPQIVEEQERVRQLQDSHSSYTPLPTGISEMPTASYANSVAELPAHGNGISESRDATPTDNRVNHFELPNNEVSTPEKKSFLNEAQIAAFKIPGVSGTAHDDMPPQVGPKPVPPKDISPSVQQRTGDLWTLPSQQGRAAHGSVSTRHSNSEDEDDSWKRDAMLHMNLAGQ